MDLSRSFLVISAHGLRWWRSRYRVARNLIYRGPRDPVGRNETSYVPFFFFSLSFSSFFFLSSRRGTDVTIFVAGRPIARTRAICPGNIPHGMPSVCPAFVSASFRFLRQHGGLSLIYPRSPNTRYFLTDVHLARSLQHSLRRKLRRDSRIGWGRERKRFDDVWSKVSRVCKILTNLWFGSIFGRLFGRKSLRELGKCDEVWPCLTIESFGDKIWRRFVRCEQVLYEDLIEFLFFQKNWNLFEEVWFDSVYVDRTWKQLDVEYRSV